MLRTLSFAIALLTLVSTLPLRAAPLGDPMRLSGMVQAVAALEEATPATMRFRIGEEVVDVAGPLKNVVAACVGLEVEVDGLAAEPTDSGGRPLLTVRSISVAPSQEWWQDVTYEGKLETRHAVARVGGRMFTAEGRLGEALRQAHGERLRIEGRTEALMSAAGERPIEDEVPLVLRVQVHRIVALDVDRVMHTFGAGSKDLLEVCRKDALGRYSKVKPGTPPGSYDGANPKIKTSAYLADKGEYHVTVDTFGGIMGSWFEDAILYRYDKDGAFLAATPQ